MSIRELTITFGKHPSERMAVDRVNLDIAPGEFVCLLGPSGCGKSTVLNAVAGFVKPYSGAISIDGVPVRKPSSERGMVFQQPTLFPWKTVLRNVAYGPRVAGRRRAEADDIARRLLAKVGLSAFVDAYPQSLSGGMQQRVGIARALANTPSVLLMDEPFGALDAQTRTLMQEVLLKIWQDLHPTVLFVTHDIEEAVFLADRVAVMSAGPGRIIDQLGVPLARPRSADLVYRADFIRLKRHCADLIRSESIRAFNAGTPG